MRKLFLPIIIASVLVSCEEDPGPMGAGFPLVSNTRLTLNDTSWVYDSVNHVYNAKEYCGMLDENSVNKYEVKMGYGYLNSYHYLPYLINNIEYTFTYKELEVDLKARPLIDTLPAALNRDFVVCLFK